MHKCRWRGIARANGVSPSAIRDIASVKSNAFGALRARTGNWRLSMAVTTAGHAAMRAYPMYGVMGVTMA